MVLASPSSIAQWAVDNRFPKSENEKVSDFEFYHFLQESIEKLVQVEKDSVLVSTSCDQLPSDCTAPMGGKFGCNLPDGSCKKCSY